MIGLVVGALRARRAQTVALFLLTVLAAVGGSAAPWFAGWAHEAVARADIAAAPVRERLVTVTGSVRYRAGADSPATVLRAAGAASLTIPGADVVVGLDLFTTISPVGRSSNAGQTLQYRDRACAQLTIVAGTCPSADGEILLSRRVATALGLAPGDPVEVSGLESPRRTGLVISGLYEIADVLSPYWATHAVAVAGPTAPLDDAAFTTEATMLRTAAVLGSLNLEYRVLLPPSAYHDSGGPLTAQLAAADHDLRARNLDLESSAGLLVERIGRDQALVATAVEVATGQLVLLCWFVLYLAVRATADARRPDIGLLKLRGTAGWRTLGLTALQSAVPMVAGAAVGWAGGFLVARGLAGAPVTGVDGSAGWLSLAAAAGVGLGALVVCVAAELGGLRAPVAALMRRIPGRRAGWRTQILDLVAVVLAVAGVYQGYADLDADGRPSAFALVAPGLVALAVALLVARTLPWLAAGGAAAALRSGRSGLALSALPVARRPGTQRVFAVVSVAVSVLATTLFFQAGAVDAWHRRAVTELGAARVLTVRAADSATLLAAVRALDPAGRYAMAVARGAGVRAGDRVLAVDTTRLAAVALLPGDSGLPDPATLAARLRPPTPAPVTVHDGQITVDVDRSTPATGTVGLTVQVVDRAGVWRDVAFGGLDPGRHRYPAEVSGCADGCRLGAIRLDSDEPGVTVDLYGVAQGSTPVVTGDQFADIARWRPPTGPATVANVLAAGAGRLRLSVYSGETADGIVRDRRVFAVAAPTPVPVALVGPPPTADRAADPRLLVLGSVPLDYTVVATGTVLPRLAGNGALMDLEYAELSLDGATEAVGLEVWLTADAPAALVTGLSRYEVRVVSDESVAGRTADLRDQAPGLALRFELLAAAILILLAAGTVLVSSTVERGPRAVELRALRDQGLTDRATRVAAYTGAVVVTGGAVVVGLVAALLADSLVTATLPVFADRWDLLALHHPRATALGTAAVAAVVVVGGAGLAGAGATVRAVRSARRDGDA